MPASGFALVNMLMPSISYCRLLHSTSTMRPRSRLWLDTTVRAFSIQFELQMMVFSLGSNIFIKYASDHHSKRSAGYCTRGMIASIMAGLTPHASYKFYRRLWNFNWVWKAHRVWKFGILITLAASFICQAPSSTEPQWTGQGPGEEVEFTVFNLGQESTRKWLMQWKITTTTLCLKLKETSRVLKTRLTKGGWIPRMLQWMRNSCLFFPTLYQPVPETPNIFALSISIGTWRLS